MFRPLYIALMFFALIAISIGFANAQTSTCDKRETMANTLASDRYGEYPIGIGIGLGAGANIMFEVWANEATGTWTIFRSYTNGIACIVAVGEDWISIAPPTIIDGEAS